MSLRNTSIVAALALTALASAASASILVSADFSTYADGALVGQNGWAQYNTSATAPITVSGGRVQWAGNGNTAANNQDAVLSRSRARSPSPSKARRCCTSTS